MTLTPEAGRLQAQIDSMRGEIDRMREEQVAMEQQHIYPPPRIYVARLQKALAGAGGSDRIYNAVEQDPVAPSAGKIQRDTGFTVLKMHATDRDPIPQSYATDVAVLQFGLQRVMLPVPNKLIPVIDVGPTVSGPWERDGRFADITDDGSPSPFRATLPIMNANKIDQYFGTPKKYPYKTDNVYVGIHVWPFLDSAGDSVITGVDKDDGFFIVWTPPPGELAETLTLAPGNEVDSASDSDTVSDGGTVDVEVSIEIDWPEYELDRDGQGNLLDARVLGTGGVTLGVTVTGTGP